MSCRKHRSPHSPTVGVGRRLATPDDRRHEAVDAVGAAVREHAEVRYAAPCTTRARVRAGSTRRRASRRREARPRRRARSRLRSASLGRVEHAVDGRPRELLGAQPTSSHGRRRGAQRGSAGSRFERIRHGRSSASAVDRDPLVRPMHRIEPRIGRDRRRLRAPAASSHAFAILLVSGAPTRTTRSGRCAAGERRRAEQRLVGRDRVRPAPQPARSGRRARGQPAAAANRVTVAGVASAPQPATSDAARVRAHASPRAPRRAAASGRTGAPARHGPRSHRRAARARRPSGAPVGTSGSRNGRLRCTGPGGGPTACAATRGTRAHATSRPHRVRSARRTGIAEPAHRVAVQLRLVDRLPRAGVAQLGRPVGGAHEQRYARVRRLDDRGMEVRGRGPRGAAHDRGPAAREPDAERAERGRALVEHDVDADPVVAGERERERRRTRAGRDDRVGDTRPRPLVDQRSARTRSLHVCVSSLAGCACGVIVREWSGDDRLRARLHADRGRGGARSCAARRASTTRSCSAICRSRRPSTETAHADRRARWRRHLRRLLDGRPAVPAPRARPSRPRARARARERVAGHLRRPRTSRRVSRPTRSSPQDIERDGVDAFLAALARAPMFASFPPGRSGARRPAPLTPEYLAASPARARHGSDGADVGPLRGAGDAGAARHRDATTRSSTAIASGCSSAAIGANAEARTTRRRSRAAARAAGRARRDLVASRSRDRARLVQPQPDREQRGQHELEAHGADQRGDERRRVGACADQPDRTDRERRREPARASAHGCEHAARRRRRRARRPCSRRTAARARACTEAHRERALARDRVGRRRRARCSRAGSPHAGRPTASAPHHAVAGNRSCCTYALPTVATNPKNTSTITSPSPM